MIQARKIDFTTFSGNYSLEEQDTGYTWANGEKIYKKTVAVGSLPNNTGASSPHNIKNLNRVIKTEMFWHDGVNNQWFTSPRIDSSDIFISLSGVGQSTVSYRAIGTDWSTRTSGCHITIYYTKNS